MAKRSAAEACQWISNPSSTVKSCSLAIVFSISGLAGLPHPAGRQGSSFPLIGGVFACCVTRANTLNARPTAWSML